MSAGPVPTKVTAFSSKSEPSNDTSNAPIHARRTAIASTSTSSVSSTVRNFSNFNSFNVGATTSRVGSNKKTEYPLKHASGLSEIKKNVTKAISSASKDTVDIEACHESWRDQFETFVQILPDADPSYLEEKAHSLLGMEEEIRLFVADALEKREYPSKKDWLWRQEQLALQKKYTEEFSVKNFLEIIPDPFSFFPDPKRSCNRNLGEVYLRNK